MADQIQIMKNKQTKIHTHKKHQTTYKKYDNIQRQVNKSQPMSVRSRTRGKKDIGWSQEGV